MLVYIIVGISCIYVLAMFIYYASRKRKLASYDEIDAELLDLLNKPR